MADPNVVNIKGLPRIEEIVDGNLLIVENEQGTNTLDFVNFVIGPNNTSFYSEITDLSDKLISLSAETASLITDLTDTTLIQLSGLETYFNSRYDTLSANVQTDLINLSTQVDAKLSVVSGVLHASGIARFLGGDLVSQVQSVTKPYPVDITANDISLSLAVPLTANAYILNADVANAGTGTTFLIRITDFYSTSGDLVRWNVTRPYYIEIPS